MSNWHYASKVPTDPWRSAMTLPRELSLRDDRLIQTPIPHPEGFPEITFTTSNGSVKIYESADRYVEVGVRDKKLFVDTTNAWNELEAPTLQEIPIGDREIDIRVIIDRSSLEVFADAGAISVTNLVFVETALRTFEIIGDVKALKSQQLYREQQG
jgi:sucrose-6-phosphate hydrolase SacC (GH32 family)